MFFLFGVDTIIFPWLFNAIRETPQNAVRGFVDRPGAVLHQSSAQDRGIPNCALRFCRGPGHRRAQDLPSNSCDLVIHGALPFVSDFLIGVFDAGAVDAHAASKLRVSALQAAAIASCGALILSGLAGYVLAEQKDPSKRASHSVMYVMFLSNYLCAIFVGRRLVSRGGPHPAPPRRA